MRGFVDVVNHTKGFSFSRGIITLGNRKFLAGVVHILILVRLSQLHECTSDRYV
mgnify:FL=1